MKFEYIGRASTRYFREEGDGPGKTVAVSYPLFAGKKYKVTEMIAADGTEKLVFRSSNVADLERFLESTYGIGPATPTRDTGAIEN